MSAQPELVPNLHNIITLPDTKAPNKKHPSNKDNFTYGIVTNLISDEIKDHSIFTMDNSARFSMTVTRPVCLGTQDNIPGSNKKKNKAYNVAGVYIIWQVKRAEILHFLLKFDNGDLDYMFKNYACYFGESDTAKPSDGIGGRVNSLRRDVVKQLAANVAPARSTSKEASAYKLAQQMLANYALYVEPNAGFTTAVDCLFASYVDIATIQGYNGQAVESDWVERTLIMTYKHNGLLVNQK
jgi:hypothetical protein